MSDNFDEDGGQDAQDNASNEIYQDNDTADMQEAAMNRFSR
jgi:hypothetical protein